MQLGCLLMGSLTSIDVHSSDSRTQGATWLSLIFATGCLHFRQTSRVTRGASRSPFFRVELDDEPIGDRGCALVEALAAGVNPERRANQFACAYQMRAEREPETSPVNGSEYGSRFNPSPAFSCFRGGKYCYVLRDSSPYGVFTAARAFCGGNSSRESGGRLAPCRYRSRPLDGSVERSLGLTPNQFGPCWKRQAVSLDPYQARIHPRWTRPETSAEGCR